MNKSKAIELVENYFANKTFSWEIIFVADKEPIEFKGYWVFKNLYEPREAIRGNNVYVDKVYPKIIVDKEDGTMKEIKQDEFEYYGIN